MDMMTARKGALERHRDELNAKIESDRDGMSVMEVRQMRREVEHLDHQIQWIETIRIRPMSSDWKW